MTDTPTPAVLVDAQDPLPESNWLWRRVLTFTAIIIVFLIMVGLGYAVHRIVGAVIEKIDTISPEAVREITVRALDVIEKMFGDMFWSLLVVVTYYMVAPSAEQIVKMISAVSLLKGGVQTGRRTLLRDGGRVMDETTAAGTAVRPDFRPVGRDSGAPGADTPGTADGAPSAPPWEPK